MIRGTLANHAIDAALARAIFDEITGAAVGGSLESLKIDPEINGLGEPDLGIVAWWLELGWLCFRDPEDAGQVVVRLDRENRPGGRKTVLAQMGLHRSEMESVDQEFKDVWNELWPGKGGRGLEG